MTRLIGAGAFAWVYEAVDLDLEVPVALKVLRPEFAGNPAAEARFRREATTAARLRHPNIVVIRDVGEADGVVFVAMDLLPLSLARRLEVLPRLPESEVVRLALDVAAALSIAHADGIVHRDIKPDNVMLGSNGEAIVADFGLADAFSHESRRNGATDASTDAGKVMGTPHYFSPEQARGLVLDGRTDLYSLGVTCYRAATGALPFEGDDFNSIARQHVEDQPVPPRMLVPELSEGFEAIVLKLMAKQPETRFASATLLADALLMLPTAPVSRSVAVTPMGGSITQVAFPYVHGAVQPAPKSRRKTAMFGLAGVAAIAFAALYALQDRPGLAAAISGNGDSATTTIPVPLSDSAPAQAQSAPAQPSDSATRPLLSAKPPAVKAMTPNRSPALNPLVLVSFSAPDSAILVVNDQVVARGQWENEMLAGREHKFRARLEPTLPGCKSADRESVHTFSRGQPASVYLDVENCGYFLLTVRSDEADYMIRDRDGGIVKQGPYHGVPIPMVLQYGTYQLNVHSDRCTDYNDTLTVVKSRVPGADTVLREVRLMCETARRK